MTEQRRCERCGGSGEVVQQTPHPPPNEPDHVSGTPGDDAPTTELKVPCPDCGGAGILSGPNPLTSWD